MKQIIKNINKYNTYISEYGFIYKNYSKELKQTLKLLKNEILNKELKKNEILIINYNIHKIKFILLNSSKKNNLKIDKYNRDKLNHLIKKLKNLLNKYNLK